FLTSCSVSDECACGRGEGNFALCGGRPKGAALWKPAAFEKAGETFSRGFAAQYSLHVLLQITIYRFTDCLTLRNLKNTGGHFKWIYRNSETKSTISTVKY
ncbi:MAG: hypothetical protein NC395_01175, partial [Prevotella sp.]|nr:hypothetical protein [Prevotella sp.]